MYVCGMQKIFSHIAYLLTKHECVILPGVGAFIVYYSATKYTEGGEVLIAPQRTLGFNPELQHNDGLLAGSLMRAEQISYEEANRLVLQFCQEFNDTLISKGSFRIPLVGMFSRTDETLLFTPAKTELSTNALLYGFTNFHIPLLSELEASRPVYFEKEVKKAPVILFNKRVWKTIGVAAAAVVGMLLLSTPIDDIQVPTQYAAVLSPFSTEQSKTSKAGPVLSGELKNRLVVSGASSDTVRKKDDFVLKIDTVKPDTISPVLKMASEKAYYYIVISSFPSQKDADKALATLRETFKNAEILEGKDRYRIYVTKYEDKNEAERFLSEFRKSNPKHEDAWLLTQRPK